jgi:predicted ATPase
MPWHSAGVFLDAREDWARERRPELEASGVEVILSKRSETEKPAQCVSLRTAGREAEVCVWASGECEAAFGSGSAEFEQSHHDLQKEADLLTLLDLLSARLLLPDA